jgi:ABC-2 type transport system permease protein
MMDTLKSEYRKLVTVRSTYFIIGICVALLIIFAFIISGFQMSKAESFDPTRLSTVITGSISVVSLFASIVGALIITHEYRYNTIMYTLTASNSRSRVMFSKIIVMTGFAIVFVAVFMTLAPTLTILGAHLHNIKLVPQTIYYKDVIWKGFLYGWGYVMAGLLLGFLIRNVIGTIVTLLLFPTAVESLLGELLKHYSVYMPFTALSEVLGQRGGLTYTISATKGAVIFISYLVVGWIIAWILFLRRDAN